MKRSFKHRGFSEIRGADACVIDREAALVMPAFTSKGILVIEGECIQHRQDGQAWPDMVCKLNRQTLGRIVLGKAGAFRHTFDIGHVKGAKGLELKLSFDYDRMPPVFSFLYRLKGDYRRRRRRMLQAMGRDVHLHRITLDGRVLADFTHGCATFLREFSIEELGLGMNIVGFFEHDFGIGESARCCAAAAKAAGIPIALNLAKMGTQSEPSAAPWSDNYQTDNPYPVNVFHLDSPQIKFVRQSLGRKFTAHRYNIGFWHWELPEYPDYAMPNMDYVDEVWVPTEFVRQSMAEKSPVPVLVIPHSVEFGAPEGATRAQFGLPPDDFLFLVMYDINSSQNRKNPQAAIKAFRAAFPNPKGVKLVVKTHGGKTNPEAFLELQKLAGNSPDIVLINRTLIRGEMHALENLCDCYVSLHRSEGFGLGLAESMFLGKPAIATNWSGNLEFMDVENACMVNYELVEVRESCGPYKKGQVWAEANHEHAAQWMKKIVDDPAFRMKIALKGKARMLNDFSRLSIGKRYEKRLRALGCWI